MVCNDPTDHKPTNNNRFQTYLRSTYELLDAGWSSSSKYQYQKAPVNNELGPFSGKGSMETPRAGKPRVSLSVSQIHTKYSHGFDTQYFNAD